MKGDNMFIIYALILCSVVYPMVSSPKECKTESIKKAESFFQDFSEDNNDGDWNENTASPARFIIQYEDDSFSDDFAYDGDYEKHIIALEQHYPTRNQEWIESLPDLNYSYYCLSDYGPFVEFQYENSDDFWTLDYYTLLDEGIIYSEYQIAQLTPSDNSARETEKTDAEHPWTEILEELGLTDDSYSGRGIKIGSIEEGIPLIDVNLQNITYYTNGDYATEHCSLTSSIYGGDQGIARDAELYFASENNLGAIKSIDWMVANRVDIINQSAGHESFGTYDSLAAYVDYIVSSTGIMYVCSAGNSGDYIASPAIGVNVLAVGASDRGDKCWIDSSYKTVALNSKCKPNIVAPGVNITGIPNQDIITEKQSITGTSFSAPIVTGIIALLMEEFPDLKSNPSKIISLLQSSAMMAEGQTSDFDSDVGFGIVNYTNARDLYSTSYSFSTYESLKKGDIVYQSRFISIPFGASISVNSVLLNPFSQNPLISDIYLDEFFRLKLTLIDIDSKKEYDLNRQLSNINYFSFKNTTYSTEYPSQSFRIKITLDCLVYNTTRLKGGVTYNLTRGSGIPAEESVDGLIIKNGEIVSYNPTDKSINSITIPDSVSSIKSRAFYGHTELTNVVFTAKSQLKSIEDYAFEGCTNLKAFILPTSVETLSYGTFYLDMDLVVYTSLTKPKSTWDELWNVCYIDYNGIAGALGSGKPLEQFYSYVQVRFGV